MKRLDKEVSNVIRRGNNKVLLEVLEDELKDNIDSLCMTPDFKIARFMQGRIDILKDLIKLISS